MVELEKVPLAVIFKSEGNQISAKVPDGTNLFELYGFLIVYIEILKEQLKLNKRWLKMRLEVSQEEAPIEVLKKEAEKKAKELMKGKDLEADYEKLIKKYRNLMEEEANLTQDFKNKFCNVVKYVLYKDSRRIEGYERVIDALLLMFIGMIGLLFINILVILLL